MTPKRIIWHHSESSIQDNQSPHINEWHKARAFPISSLGYYIGYHFVIEKNGSVFKARETNEIGAHDAGENIDSIGICLAGDFNKGLPTRAQELSMRVVVLELMLKYGISLNAIEPHRRDDATDCPGKNLPDNFPIGLL